MPNKFNVNAPINLVANGRSGTSLVSQIFKNHPDFVYVGETANLIHSVYKSMVSSLPQIRHKEVPDVIRMIFLKMYETPEKFWFQKPIGIPIVKNYWRNEDEFIVWYWRVFTAVFPKGKYFTILRHPLDIVTSSNTWWNLPHKSIINSNRMMAKIITHPDSKIKYAVNFESIVKNPEEETRKLLDHLELDFHEDCLLAFKKEWVTSSDPTKDKEEEEDLETKQKKAFSKKEKWALINKELITEEYKTAVEDCWTKFGYDFGGWE